MPDAEPNHRQWLATGLLLASTLLLAWLFWNVLSAFAFVHTDMDQTMMWYGAHEFSAGRFHQPRFFGQAYGSMLESLVAVPLLFLPIHKALVCATSFLFLLPYAIIVLSSPGRVKNITLAVLFLSVMPATYLMLGTMPRDLVSGIAVASLSIFWLHRPGKWSYLWVGLFAVLGWSTNHGAAILGVTVMAYKLWSDGVPLTTRSAFLFGGVTIALLIHLGIDQFFIAHPEFVVHHAWEFSYHLKQLFRGISNMDMHFGRITPFLKGQGIIYPLLFCLLALGAHVQDNNKAFWATIIVSAFTLLSFGVLKVHDGFDSIFSSYERMFMALPVAVFFLMANMRLPQWTYPVMATVALCYAGMQLATLDRLIASEVSSDRDHLLAFAPAESVYESMAQIKAVTDEVHPEGVIIGPDADWLTYYASGACFLINDTIPIVHPRYDRKTWDMRRMDQPVFSRILWITDGTETLKNTAFTMEPIVNDGLVFKAYLVSGENLNPLEVYRSFGYFVCDH